MTVNMPKVLVSTNPDQSLADGLHYLETSGLRQNSRNGPVLAAPSVVVVFSPNPLACISVSQLRNANPFFHAIESLWMLAGCRDAASLQQYVPRITEFADTATTLHGAYGYRWRNAFSMDQLESLAALLRKEPETRRAVLQMWSADLDLGKASVGKDLPCNTECVFRVTDGNVLHMIVHNRSNDAVWGCHGANVVHFSGLLNFMAWATALRVGTMTQVSSNYHIYTEREDVKKLLGARNALHTAGTAAEAETPRVGYATSKPDSQKWRSDAYAIVHESRPEIFSPEYCTARFGGCRTLMSAAALRNVHHHYKINGVQAALGAAAQHWAAAPNNWLLAAERWLSWRVAR